MDEPASEPIRGRRARTERMSQEGPAGAGRNGAAPNRPEDPAGAAGGVAGGTAGTGPSYVDRATERFLLVISVSVITAVAFEAVAGIGFGLIAGVRKGGWFDATVLVLSLVVIAVPTFVIGFVLQFIVGVRLGWLPVTAGESPGFTELLMPAMVLGAVSFAYVLRLTRTEVAENLTADHVRTARAKGLSGARVMIVHVLRNSLVPVVTFLGADLGALMGGAIVTEGIFNIKGVGGTLYSAIIRGDGPMVVSFTTVLVLVFIISNLLVDLLYAALDPRIRYA